MASSLYFPLPEDYFAGGQALTTDTEDGLRNLLNALNDSIGGDDTISARCPVGTAIGDALYISGPKQAGAWTMQLADITNQNKLPIAIATAHPHDDDPTLFVVQVNGEISAGYSGLTPGMPYYFGRGPGARLTATPPEPGSTEILFLQQAGFATSTSSFYMFYQPPYYLVGADV